MAENTVSAAKSSPITTCRGAESLVIFEAEVEESAACLTALAIDDRNGGAVGELSVYGPRLEVGHEILWIARVLDRHTVRRSSDFELPLGEYGLVRLQHRKVVTGHVQHARHPPVG